MNHDLLQMCLHMHELKKRVRFCTLGESSTETSSKMYVYLHKRYVYQTYSRKSLLR